VWELLLDELHLRQLLGSGSITLFPVHQLGDEQREEASQTGATGGTSVTIGATDRGKWERKTGKEEEDEMDIPLSDCNNDETQDSPISSSFGTCRSALCPTSSDEYKDRSTHFLNRYT
jgi:hypothetical protein